MLPMSNTMSAAPMKMTQSEPSSQTALAASPFLTFSTTLITMPVFRWIKPSTIAPMSTVILSVIGLNRHHSSPQPSGFPSILPTCSIAFPKKPPVSIPMMKVDIPAHSRSWQNDSVPARGLIFFIATTAAIIIKRP